MFAIDDLDNLPELQQVLRRVRELSDAAAPYPKESRDVARHSRAIPTLLVPWENERLVMREATFAVTRDLSDGGVGLLLHQPFRAEAVIVGFRTSDKADEEASVQYLLAETQQNVPIGGGFWVLGLALTEVYKSPLVHKQLASFAAQLVPTPCHEPKPSELLGVEPIG